MASKYFDMAAAPAIDWGATAASLGGSKAGAASVPKLEAKPKATDVIDNTLPSLEGVVVARSMKTGQGGAGIPGIRFTVVVTADGVSIPADCASAFRVGGNDGDGTPYIVATAKLPAAAAEGKKVAMPRTYKAPLCVNVGGAVVVEVKTKKNAPGSGGNADLTEAQVPLGSLVRLNNVAFDAVLNKPMWSDNTEHQAFGSAKTIDLLSKGPAHPRAAADALMAAIKGSSCTHAQVIAAAFDHIGYRPDALPEDVAAVREDAVAIGAKMREREVAEAAGIRDALAGLLEKHTNARVGIGERWEHPIFSDTAKEEWKGAIEAMDVPTNSFDPLKRLTTSALTRAHVLPLAQFGTEPGVAVMLNRGASGLSQTTAALADTNAAKSLAPPDMLHFAETVISLATSKKRKSEAPETGRSDEDIRSTSMGSAAWDVVAMSVGVRSKGDDGFVVDVPRLSTKETIAIKQFTDSCKKGQMVDTVGMYDFLRYHVVLDALLPLMPAVLYPKIYGNCKQTLDMPPVNEAEWAGDQNVYDVATAVESCVQVSPEWLKANAADDEGYFFVPEIVGPSGQKTSVQIQATDSGGKELAPRPPKLDVHGYTALNALPETSIRRLNKLPPGSTGVKVFAVFEGVAAAVAADPLLNCDTAAGEAFLAAKYGDELKLKLAYEVGLYATAQYKPVKVAKHA